MSIVGPDKSWRLIYNEAKTWYKFFESDGYTETIDILEEFKDSYYTIGNSRHFGKGQTLGVERILELGLINQIDIEKAKDKL